MQTYRRWKLLRREVKGWHFSSAEQVKLERHEPARFGRNLILKQ